MTTPFTPIFFVGNKQGQFLRKAPEDRHFGVRWTFNKDEATSFTTWHDAHKFAHALPTSINKFVRDQLGDIWTKARAFNKGVFS